MKYATIRSLLVLAASALALPSAAADGTGFAVYPPQVNLDTARDHQSLVVQLTQGDGVTRDVTAECQLSLDNPVAKVEGNVLKPQTDGSATLTVKYQDHSAAVPVTVKQATTDRPVSFKLDIMPIFMRAGCNSGSCHGSARGKDGFRLSLFGYDPDGDYFRLTREIALRRINLAVPEDSLMLTKATGTSAHTGGKRFEKDSHHYAEILRWLNAGAPQDPPTVATPTSLEILPKNAVLEGEGATQRMTVRAHYSDGTDRDVTSLALFLSNNDNSAKIDENAVVTAGKRGEAFVMARFATFTVGSQVIVIPKGLKYAWSDVPENNYIDTLVNAKLKKLRLTPSQLCTDDEFARRVYLDVVGVLPTREEYEKFASDTDPKKREKLVDELLNRKEFVEMWVMKFAELLQVRSVDNRVSYKAALLYYNWLQDRLSRNVPMNQVVRELLGANGGTFKNPATNYYQIEADVEKIAENTAQVFMGMRIQCSQCHNHPFDRWTMNDYYGFVSFFTQVGRKQGEDPRETVVFNQGGGEKNNPVTNKPVVPTFLGGGPANVNGKDRRVVLADWLASPENPYFAKNLANIVWAHFMGKGIVEPVDDVRVSNPASNPELLDTLGKKFTEYNYDFKRLVRDICTSRTYQLSSQTNESNAGDSLNFAHATVRRIRAEVLLDCITQATDSKEKFRGLPLGARAVQIADGNTTSYFLRTFGRATRETVCSCEVKMEPNLGQALHLLNGQTTNGKIQQGGLVKKLLTEQKLEPAKVVEELYVRCLQRKPTEQEAQKLNGYLAEAKKPEEKQQVLEDLFWALLNSQEFMFNH